MNKGCIINVTHYILHQSTNTTLRYSTQIILIHIRIDSLDLFLYFHLFFMKLFCSSDLNYIYIYIHIYSVFESMWDARTSSHRYIEWSAFYKLKDSSIIYVFIISYAKVSLRVTNIFWKWPLFCTGQNWKSGHRKNHSFVHKDEIPYWFL